MYSLRHQLGHVSYSRLKSHSISSRPSPSVLTTRRKHGAGGLFISGRWNANERNILTRLSSIGAVEDDAKMDTELFSRYGNAKLGVLSVKAPAIGGCLRPEFGPGVAVSMEDGARSPFKIAIRE